MNAQAPDSAIQVVDGPEGLTCSWMPPRRIGRRIALGLFHIVALAFWSFCLIAITRANYTGFTTGVWSAPEPMLIAIWLFMAPGGIAFVAGAIGILTPSLPEKIELRDNLLAHDQGYDHSGDPVSFFFRNIAAKRICKYSREEVSEPILAHINGDAWLSIDHGKRRVWIGNYLNTRDKEWLYGKLQAWKHGNRIASS